jgi:S1-C subfamily serine protease
MGFPFGLSLQDLKTSKGIRILANGGSITQECTEYSFGFNAPSYGGASGSPIFNAKGQLIGVLNSGVRNSQGFNYAVKAVHVKELYDKTLSK